MRVLILCTHNSARSQMAEGWVRHYAAEAGLNVEVVSAGTQKTRVKFEAVAVMGSGSIPNDLKVIANKKPVQADKVHVV